MTGDYKTPTTPGTTASTTPGTTTPGKIVPGVTPGTSTLGSAASSSAGATESHRHEAWQPRVQKDPPFNAFETDGARSPDARSPSSTIRDPARDTAPLQGENDISDSDSLSNEYTPNQDRAVRGGDTPVNDRGGQS